MKTIKWAVLVTGILGTAMASWALESAVATQATVAVAEMEPGYEWNAATPYPDRVVLTWSEEPTTTQSVTWRTDMSVTTAVAEVAIAEGAPGFVYNATSVPATTERVDARDIETAGVAVNYHTATFRELLPDTLYAYRVGDGERWTEWYQFRTASAEPEPFTFVYFGDAQNDVLPLWSRVIRQSYATAPDVRFMIHAGDLINTAHADAEWGEWFRAGGHLNGMVPSVPVPGNHEYRGYTEAEDDAGVDRLSAFWRPQFALPENGAEGVEPETNYYMDYQGVRFVLLDSNGKREEQAAWLEQVLSASPHDWIVVAHHHPIFSSANDRDNATLRNLWKPIYDLYGVDLVLQGHDHTYARGRTQNLPDGTSLRDDESGTVYVVSVSGRKMYDFKPSGWTNYPVRLERQAENTQLFQVIQVEGGTLRYRAYTATGQVYDDFAIVQRAGRPNQFVDRMAAGAPTYGYDNTAPYRW